MANRFLKAKLDHLNRFRRYVLERMGKALGVSKLEWFVSLTNPLSVQTLNIGASKDRTYQIYKDTISSLDTEIKDIQQTLAQHNEPTTGLHSSVDEDPISILKIRHATGEITKDEYAEMLKTLSSTS